MTGQYALELCSWSFHTAAQNSLHMCNQSTKVDFGYPIAFQYRHNERVIGLALLKDLAIINKLLQYQNHLSFVMR